MNITKRLKELGWSEEGAAFLAEKIETEDTNFVRLLRRRLLGERLRSKPKRKKAAIPWRLKKRVFERDAYRCQHCGGWNDLSIDHIIPESKGGPTTYDNLQTLCMPCNLSKGDDLPQ